MNRPYFFAFISLMIMNWNTAQAVPLTTHNFVLTNVGGVDSQYDSLIFSVDQDFNGVLVESVRSNMQVHRIWKDTTFLGPTGTMTTVNINTANETWQADGSLKTIELEKLTLENVNITGDAEFRFIGSDDEFNLKNSNAFFRRSPQVFSTNSFTLNAISGTNELTGFEPDLGISVDTILNVHSGASLILTNSGTVDSSSITTDRLRFLGDFNGIVDNGTLEFKNSRVQIKYGLLTLNNGGTLKLFGASTELELYDLTVNSSTVDLARNTHLISNSNIRLNNGTLNLNSGSKITGEVLLVAGASSVITPASEPGQHGVINIGLLGSTSYSNSETLDITNINSFNAERVTLDPNFTLNINSSLLRVTDDLSLNGATINVSSGSTLSVLGTYGDTPGTINVNSNGKLATTKQAGLYLYSGLNLQNSGIFESGGWVYGSGAITGTGTLAFSSDGGDREGHLSPGELNGSNLIGTIETNNRVEFSDHTASFDIAMFNNDTFVNSGLFDGGFYDVDLRLTNGAEENDQLLYGDGDVDLRLIKAINVDFLGSYTATELDGTLYTIIASSNAASGGDILIGTRDLPIVEGVNVPLLIDFSIDDLNTNGNSDVTLRAETASLTSIMHHPNLSRHPMTQSVANQLINIIQPGTINPATGAIINPITTPLSPTTPGLTATQSQILSHLDGLTNGSVLPVFSAFHAEPYSSNMTIALEQTDVIINSVLANAHRNNSSGNIALNSDAAREQSPIWGNIIHQKGDIDGDNDLADFKYEINSLLIGGQLGDTDKRTTGLFFSYGDHSMDEHDNLTQDFTSTKYHVGFYTHEKGFEDWDVRSVGGLAYGDNESERFYTLGNNGLKFDASFHSWEAFLGVQGSFDWFETNRLKLVPELGIDFTHYEQGKIKESGGDLALIVDASTAQALNTSVGINTQIKGLFSNPDIIPSVLLRYSRDWLANQNNEHEVKASFAAAPAHKEKFYGQNRGGNIFTLGLGLSTDPKASSNHSLSGGVLYTQHDHGDEISLVFNGQWTF